MSVVESALSVPSLNNEFAKQATAVSTMPNFQQLTQPKSGISLSQTPNIIEENSDGDCYEVEHQDDHLFCFNDIDDVLTIFDPFPSSEYKSDLQGVDATNATTSSLLDNDIVFSPTYPDKHVVGDFNYIQMSGGATKRKVSLGYFASDSPENKRVCSSLECLPPLPLDCDESNLELLSTTESHRVSPRIEKFNDFTSCENLGITGEVAMKKLHSFQNILHDNLTSAVCSLDGTSSNTSTSTAEELSLNSSQHDAVSECTLYQKQTVDNGSLCDPEYQAKIRHGLEKLILQSRKTSESRRHVLRQLPHLNRTTDLKGLPKSNPICFSKSQTSANDCTEAAVHILVDMNENSSDSTTSTCNAKIQDDDLFSFDFDEPSFQ